MEIPAFLTIAETFAAYHYDDKGHGRKYLESILTQYRDNDCVIRRSSEIAELIEHELGLFGVFICKNYAGEILVSPETDGKYGHWLTLTWIFNRHYQDRYVPLPAWIHPLDDIVSGRAGPLPGQRTCLQVVELLLDKLNDML